MIGEDDKPKKERKKFRDTKVGVFLKKKAPQILDVAGDLLPDKGVLGVVKNLIDNDNTISPADKSLIYEQLKELSEIEVADRDSARGREVEIAKTDKHDWMFTLTGFIGLAVFCFIVYAIAYHQVPAENKELWIHLIGISEGVVLSIFGYYFGSALRKNVQ
jgi:hypothetical protein